MDTEAVPLGITSLPPELIRCIIGFVGWSSKNYSIKEKQSDLANFALVHSTFCGPSQSCLYAHPTIRNEGRSALFHRTLDSRPSLAPLVRHLAYPASSLQDTSSPTLLNRILLKTTPSAVDLGAALFCHEESSKHLAEILTTRHDLESFKFASSAAAPMLFKLPIATPFLETALPLWRNLTHLSLTGTLAIPEEVLEGETKPEYQLNSLELSGGEVLPRELGWLLGRSRETLRELTLRQIMGAFDSDSKTIFDEDSPLHEVLPSLDSLTLDAVLGWDPIHNPASRSPHDILSSCGFRLSHLHIGNSDFSRSQWASAYDLPKNLRHLEIKGRFFFEILHLAKMLSTGYDDLEDVTLIGSFKLTDKVYTNFAGFCHERGLRLHVKKQF